MKPEYRRWYEHDPLLLEVVELLKNYQDELRSQAEVFLKKIEEKVSKDAIERFYEMVKPVKGNRWYDNDPMMLKGVELLRNAPANIQRVAALKLLVALEQKSFEGVEI